VKHSRATLFFRASAGYSKLLNNKKDIFSAVNSGNPLFFRASPSCSKIQNVKSIFHTAKNFWETLFSGQAQVVKNPECKKYTQYSEKFQGKRKLLKYRER